LEQKARAADTAYREIRAGEERQLETYVIAGVPIRGRVFHVEQELGLTTFIGLVDPRFREKEKDATGLISGGNEAVSILPDGTALGIKSTRSEREEEK
jgi:hypothetical protein